ncbi:hypothetical protein B0H14DRAFT_659179 [Mycena olivaceomarginata]|nr:hypothetical protein B0H14DRAFT_659179 [Mycena olivaceomarginata]
MVGCGALRDNDPPRQLRRTGANRAGDTWRASCMYGHPWDDFERLERGHARVGSRYACTRPHGLTRRARRAPRPRPSLHEPRFICASLSPPSSCPISNATSPMLLDTLHQYTPPFFRSATAAGRYHGHRRLHSVALPHRVPHSTSGVYLSHDSVMEGLSRPHHRCVLTSFRPAPPRCSGGHVVTGGCDIPRLSRCARVVLE